MSRIRLPIDWRSWSRSPRERPVPPRLSLLGYDECRIRGPLQKAGCRSQSWSEQTTCLNVSHWVGSLAHLSHNSDRGCYAELLEALATEVESALTGFRHAALGNGAPCPEGHAALRSALRRPPVRRHAPALRETVRCGRWQSPSIPIKFVKSLSRLAPMTMRTNSAPL